jgi:3'-phosphoadenosine 5'-phosphosulfate sulfotransferase (PAPS reductase)/FAD synthetase
MRPSLLHVVSISGGKDSTATALLALESRSKGSLRLVFADTGNEHELTYEYLDYLESALGIQIKRLRRDFTPEWNHRLHWLKSDAPKKGTARNPPRSEIEIAKLISVFEKGPTGNPFLDLCIVKGRFPSSQARFCTRFLKTEPLVEYQLGLADQGYVVWSWQGIRRDESPARANAKEFEELGGGLFIYRPIVRWSANDCFEAMQACGVEPNPLYKLGMRRVGCMPCILSGKDEISEIVRRFPHHIDRMREWESVVGSASWRQEASFFPSPTADLERRGRGIDAVAAWSLTEHGGKKINMRKLLPVLACSSEYGLCE